MTKAKTTKKAVKKKTYAQKLDTFESLGEKIGGCLDDIEQAKENLEYSRGELAETADRRNVFVHALKNFDDDAKVKRAKLVQDLKQFDNSAVSAASIAAEEKDLAKCQATLKGLFKAIAALAADLSA